MLLLLFAIAQAVSFAIFKFVGRKIGGRFN